jgi:hypothetical protein
MHYFTGPPVTCDAFPDGIPIEILKKEVVHTSPYSGDHGIQFEPRTTPLSEYERKPKNNDYSGLDKLIARITARNERVEAERKE